VLQPWVNSFWNIFFENVIITFILKRDKKHEYKILQVEKIIIVQNFHWERIRNFIKHSTILVLSTYFLYITFCNYGGEGSNQGRRHHKSWGGSCTTHLFPILVFLQYWPPTFQCLDPPTFKFLASPLVPMVPPPPIVSKKNDNICIIIMLRYDILLHMTFWFIRSKKCPVYKRLE